MFTTATTLYGSAARIFASLGYGREPWTMLASRMVAKGPKRRRFRGVSRRMKPARRRGASKVGWKRRRVKGP